MPTLSTLVAMTALAACPNPIVHDGDTIRCGIERVRLVNIDAPELAGSERCRAASRRRLAGSRNPAWCDSALGERSRMRSLRWSHAGKRRSRRWGVTAMAACWRGCWSMAGMPGPI
jgi:endonuclease YncB( thermonuclease family)